ncbi:hypothetical protein F2P81_000067 [Scophthalmus maximus]|uniref:Uncharacterized protein n=1 Tax=Scophthalmus maximus TaxID=52904 RepID=A0A6A4TT67_SCOMX|nr:hypothetical protein F2P81_000067 [Scophthalmus maximus]
MWHDLVTPVAPVWTQYSSGGEPQVLVATTVTLNAAFTNSGMQRCARRCSSTHSSMAARAHSSRLRAARAARGPGGPGGPGAPLTDRARIAARCCSSDTRTSAAATRNFFPLNFVQSFCRNSPFLFNVVNEPIGDVGDSYK